MNFIIYVLILTFGLLSYVAGVRQMLQGIYKPSIFSRVVWLFLAINSFAGVVLSHSSQASILLASIFLVGNFAICITSFWKGSRAIGLLEIICTILLLISGLVWIFDHDPLVNLAIGLVAHFIGGLPTLRRVWLDPNKESTLFWSHFFIASALSIVASWGEPLRLVIFPIYYTCFDGTMFLLSTRHTKRRKR